MKKKGNMSERKKKSTAMMALQLCDGKSFMQRCLSMMGEISGNPVVLKLEWWCDATIFFTGSQKIKCETLNYSDVIHGHTLIIALSLNIFPKHRNRKEAKATEAQKTNPIENYRNKKKRKENVLKYTNSFSFFLSSCSRALSYFQLTFLYRIDCIWNQ